MIWSGVLTGITVALAVGSSYCEEESATITTSASDSWTCSAGVPCLSKFGFCGSSEHCLSGICATGCYVQRAAEEDDYYGSSWSVIDYDILRRGEQPGVYSFCKNPMHVALTFDDGIHPYLTPRVLKILKRHGVRATFFILGNSLSRYKDLWHSQWNDNYSENREILRRMVAAGHDIGSHSFDHPALTDLSMVDLIYQLNTTYNLLSEFSGSRSIYFRAPMGALNLRLLKILKRYGMTPIHWDLDPEDWAYSDPASTHVTEYIQYNLRSPHSDRHGHIILLHDIFEGTVQKLDYIIQTILRKGYELVPMRECLDGSGSN